MENEDQQSCVVTSVAQIDAATCKNMDFGNIVKLEFDRGDGTMMFAGSDITRKFSLNDFKELTT